MTFRQFKIFWEAAYASGYQIQVSDDDSAYTDVYSTTTGQGRNEVITLDTPVTGRYVRLYCTQAPADTWDGVLKSTTLPMRKWWTTPLQGFLYRRS